MSLVAVSTPLKNMKVNWDDDIPNISVKIKLMFQSPPTRSVCVRVLNAGVVAPLELAEGSVGHHGHLVTCSALRSLVLRSDSQLACGSGQWQKNIKHKKTIQNSINNHK